MNLAVSCCKPVFESNSVRLVDCNDFSLAETLDCGQAFRWKQLETDRFIGAAGKNVCEISREGGDVILHGVDRQTFETFWREYFDLDRDYASLKKTFGENELLRRAVKHAPGIRLLRQPTWETLCSFIISQNNNISRIKGIISRLCELAGEPLGGGLYAFPTPQALAAQSEEGLAPLRAGFRARYLIDASRRVSSGEIDLESLAHTPLPQARQTLQQICGVGPKVAECVLLFGCGRLECFPIDVWMRRVMQTFYPDGLPECAIEYAGIAQQYLFHYARTCPEAFPQDEQKANKKRVVKK